MISYESYIQLVGLLALADINNKRLREIELALLAITKEEERDGHTSDALYGSLNADQLIKKLNIVVLPAKKRRRRACL